ncbi:MAG: MerR family transcriptional regulator [Chloroflexi bacterium]|jgi:MerR family transcriptional regulator/heat shock protein HspR|nr:MerR family transcriptional regulator [Chloroflexota bacterium]
MTDEFLNDDEPCYVISVAAKLVELHPQRLRYYDRIGLLRPSRTAGRIRLYSQRDVEVLRKISRLTEDLGVNLAGVEVVLNMSRRIQELQKQMELQQRQFAAEVERLRQRIRELEGQPPARTADTVVIEAEQTILRDLSGVDDT